ncbi:hypothetical protein OROHE_016925 [Orobanche hederae]
MKHVRFCWKSTGMALPKVWICHTSATSSLLKTHNLTLAVNKQRGVNIHLSDDASRRDPSDAEVRMYPKKAAST